MATAEKSIALNPIVDNVAKQISALQSEGRLRLPPNYSPENALYSAWLKLQTITDKNGRPALHVCTKESITNALLDMVIQGLSPAKNQCYFIPYGNQLVMQRSYFGTACVTMQVLKTNRPPVAAVIYKGDEFEYVVEAANKKVTKHVQRLENVKKENIIGAYCTIFPPNHEPYTEIMTIEQIHQAWRQSKMNPFDEMGNLRPDSTHAKFAEEMAKRTVLNRACKMFINSSDDSSLDLVVESFYRSEEAAEEAAFEQEVAANANQEFIEAEWHEKEDEESVEVQEAVDGGNESTQEKPAAKSEPARAESKPMQQPKRRGPSF